jgi:multimeric flavodoxin WrbA
MKKVLIIEASPRKGFCKRIGDSLTDKLRNHYELDVVSLSELTIQPCKGCASCLFAGSGKCPVRDDDAIVVLEKMIWADGIIFILPNYALGVPALLKNLFDRLAYIFHRPRLFHKVCLPIIVQGVIGGKKIAEYVNEVMSYWGMHPVKGAVVTGGVYVGKAKSSQMEQKDDRIISEAIERFSKEIHRTKARVPSLFRLLLFRMVRTSMKYSEEVLPPDKAYYQRMGWFESNYYYDVKLNPLRRALGAMSDLFAKQMATKA